MPTLRNFQVILLRKKLFDQNPSSRVSAENFPGEATEKYLKIAKKTEIALLSLFQGRGNGKKTEK